MCNPRQVEVRATRRLAEAWEQEVRRQVTLYGRAVGRAAVREQLSIGRPVLACLDRVLQEVDGWQEVDDGYRYDVAGGHVIFHSGSGELEIVAELSSDVEAAGEASATLRGEVAEELEAEGVGRYYDDGWSGFTEDRARRMAEAAAQEELDRVAAERIAQAHALAESGADSHLRAQAQESAEAALAAAAAAREAELAAEASQRLTTVGVQARAVFNLALAQAYEMAVLAYARSRRAEGLQVTRSGGVVSIAFEMEA
jgi:hypothetical protein